MNSEPEAGLASTRVQHRKLRRLLRDAVSHVPMYRALYNPLGLTDRDLADPAVLTSLPVLTKSALLAFAPEDRVDGRYRRDELAHERSTGSTGQPFSIYIDRRYQTLRNARFLRGLISVGYRPWHRLLLLTDRYAGLSRHHGWHYQSVDCPASDLLDAYLSVAPDVLYGFATPLRLLAECVLQGAASLPRPRLVVSTAEMLDAATRRTLMRAFSCPVADFYGMTEMGLVAWQRPGHAEYVLARGSVLTELVQDESFAGGYRIVMTNLDLRASPIIRFDCGDLAIAEAVNGRPVITAFAGRVIDAIACRDGTTLSPYRLTDALRDVRGLRRFQVTQVTLSHFEITLEVDTDLRDAAVRRIEAILEGMLGPGLNLKLVFTDTLVADGAAKFRPVASRVARS